jgi:hypothetical protein
MPPVLLELLYINSIYILIIAILTYSAYRRKNNMVAFWIINITYIFILGALTIDTSDTRTRIRCSLERHLLDHPTWNFNWNNHPCLLLLKLENRKKNIPSLKLPSLRLD